MLAHSVFLISQFILSGGYFVLIISKVYMNIQIPLILQMLVKKNPEVLMQTSGFYKRGDVMITLWLHGSEENQPGQDGFCHQA